MKGVVFNLLEKFVSENFGAERYEAILDDAKLQTKEPFVGPGNYPDADLVELLMVTCRHVDMPPPKALRAFGNWAFPHFARMVPRFVDIHRHPKPFLATLDSVIHMEVQKLYPGAVTPHFEMLDPAPDRLTMIYSSDRKMEDLALGLIEGVRDHFKVPFAIDARPGSHGGKDVWFFELTFEPVPGA